MTTLPRTCGYAPLRDADPCGAPATLHFLHLTGEGTGSNMFACEEATHQRAAAREATDFHPLGDVCGEPGTVWATRHDVGEGFCFHPETEAALRESIYRVVQA